MNIGKQDKLNLVVVFFFMLVVSNRAYAWGYYGDGMYFEIGTPYPYPYHRDYPLPYLTPPVVVQQAPPIYVQQAPPVYVQSPTTYQQRQDTGYWYYCQKPQGYYPYVRNCSHTWMQVLPQSIPPR